MVRAVLIGSLLILPLPLSQRAVGQRQLPNGRDAIRRLIADFTSADWQRVHVAKEAMEIRQAESIPALMVLLDQDKKVRLHNTADLIYPGAKTFYGHGWILDYDVDWISVRAGWALEDLTFQNFGFREGVINEADLMNAVIGRQGNVRLTDPSKPPDVRKQIRAEAASRAKTWWQKAGGSWNRFDSLLEALGSDDPIRQHWTLNWIRNGTTKCDGLTLDSFTKYIVPEARRLLKSSNESVRDQANYLLEDKELWWLKHKGEVNAK